MINANRRELAPLSFAAKKAYRNQDVLQALYDDFNGKCYLTEFVFSDVDLMEIDHFVTQNDDPNGLLKYEWTNLFPIHEKANKLRPKSTPVGGYLDPCSIQDNVEQEIEYRIRFDGTATFQAIDQTNLKAINTAKLLSRVHQDFKGAVGKRHHEVVDTLWKWTNACKKGQAKKVAELEILLHSLFSRHSLFTMLMRSIDDVPAEFFD